MKAQKIISAIVLLLTMNIAVMAQEITEIDPTTMIFPAEHKGPTSNNIGEVHLSVLKHSGNNMITNFVFSAGSRNYWHVHPNAEQTLLVLDGEGYYQEEGRPKQIIRKGDVIVTKPNVVHWNGASSKKNCVCLTVTEKNKDVHVTQIRPVTDEEYIKVDTCDSSENPTI